MEPGAGQRVPGHPRQDDLQVGQRGPSTRLQDRASYPLLPEGGTGVRGGAEDRREPLRVRRPRAGFYVAQCRVRGVELVEPMLGIEPRTWRLQGACSDHSATPALPRTGRLNGGNHGDLAVFLEAKPPLTCGYRSNYGVTADYKSAALPVAPRRRQRRYYRAARIRAAR